MGHLLACRDMQGSGNRKMARETGGFARFEPGLDGMGGVASLLLAPDLVGGAGSPGCSQ
jgi:hypothetical protein